MISIATVVIAAVLAAALLIITFVAPNPFTLVGTLIVGGALFFYIWPKYQAQHQAMRQGVTIQAAVQEVRHWNQKHTDEIEDNYEIVAVAPNPQNGKIQKFVSPPMQQDPQPYLGNSVKVTVDWSNPLAYVMDLSFLPFKVQ